VADAERLQHEPAEARHHLLAGLQLLKTKADWIYSADDVIPYVAYYAAGQRMIKQSSIFLGWIENWNKTNRHVQPPVYRKEFDQCVTEASEQLPGIEFAEAWAEGQSMSQEQVFSLAMEVLQ